METLLMSLWPDASQDRLAQLKPLVEELVNSRLRPREKKVLQLRFGMFDGIMYSLRGAGHLLRISKERVRMIQNRALEKIRAEIENDSFDPCI